MPTVWLMPLPPLAPRSDWLSLNTFTRFEARQRWPTVQPLVSRWSTSLAMREALVSLLQL